MNEFFNSEQPYVIADNITKGHELTNDLVSFVYLAMYDYKKPIEDPVKFFTTLATNQWRWCDSEFNKTYKQTYIELNENMTPDKEEEFIESEYKKFLRDYLESDTTDLVEWYKKEMAKLFIQGMTYREIQSRTTINLRYISESLKQFKHDVSNNFNSRSIKHGNTEPPTT